MLSQIETDILKSIASDDELAYEGLFKAYFAELTVYVFRFLEDMENAEKLYRIFILTFGLT